jgi:hypothetical protein
MDLWSATVTLARSPTSHAGGEGEYLYRYQPWWKNAAGQEILVTNWFPDPFARSTDIGLMSSTVLARTPAPFAWTAVQTVVVPSNYGMVFIRQGP